MTAIWKLPISLETLKASTVGSVDDYLGVEYLEVGDDFLRARMPVNERTRQPMGILHGGMSVVLAESLGSIAASFSVPPGHRVVGLDINANHLRSVSEGWVTGTVRPIHIGRTTHVWQIDLVNDDGKPTCVSRLTMAVLAPRD
ncbi:MAG: hotdog fold thioesterase [Burkholderiales bacterium]